MPEREPPEPARDTRNLLGVLVLLALVFSAPSLLSGPEHAPAPAAVARTGAEDSAPAPTLPGAAPAAGSARPARHHRAQRRLPWASAQAATQKPQGFWTPERPDAVQRQYLGPDATPQAVVYH